MQLLLRLKISVVYNSTLTNQPLQIYFKERNLPQAEACFRECLKLKCENKTINWMLRKRIRNIANLLTQKLPSNQVSSQMLSNCNITAQSALVV